MEQGMESEPQIRIRELERQLVEALGRIDELAAENRQLRDQLEQAQKEAARQAAPFRRSQNKKVPPEERKRPGRKAGHPGVNRRTPEHIDQTVTAPLGGCPQCHGPLQDVAERVQYVEEIPVVRPTVTKIITYTGHCPCCGNVESTHPLQTGRGSHASAVHLGPRAIALAALLNKHHGVTMRKTCRILKDGFGLMLSPGGLSQALDRLADRCDADYQQLLQDVRAGPAAYVDETSWWVGGPGQWLHVFANASTTFYRVEASRGSEVVNQTLTSYYKGVLVSDCLNIYDKGTPIARKHKCIGHHQKKIREQLNSPGLDDPTYLQKWKKLFESVCTLTSVKGSLPPERLMAAHANFTAQADALLAQPVTQEQDCHIQNRLAKQRDYLFTCLTDSAVEATNNRAERALRPAVIARKVSCGNKTERGKTTWERLASLTTTFLQRGKDILAFFTGRATIADTETER
jgi:transposase